MNANSFASRVLWTAAAFAICGVGRALAVPVNGFYIEDSRCDVLTNRALNQELGDVLAFPLNSALQVNALPTSAVVCVPNDGIANDWVVRMTNLTGQSWQDVFFVANDNIKIGNADGVVADLTNAAVLSDAFRIDGTVTPGGNNSLIENVLADEIFSPGETWQFLVTNFQHPSGISPMPTFLTPGIFAGSAGVTADTASILARPYVPEPSFLGVIGMGAIALLSRRPRRA